MDAMETIVRDLMTSPPVTCASTDSLAVAARIMARGRHRVGRGDRAGARWSAILTERDLLRAAAAAAGPDHEAVGLWMTAHPDVLRPDEKVDAAWASLTAHHYRHLPVVEGDELVGVVSLRDLMGMARIRPAAESSDRRAGRARGRGGGRDHGGRRAGPGGLLPLPPVLGRRAGRAALARGRLASPVQGGAARRGRLGGLRPAGARPARRLPPGLAALLPALAAPGRAARRAAQRRVGARGRARLAADPRHRRRGAGRPGARPVRRRADHPGLRPTACGEGLRARRAPRRTSTSPPTTCACSPARCRAMHTPGPSSST